MSRWMLGLGLVAALGAAACSRRTASSDAAAPADGSTASSPGTPDELVVDPFCGVRLKRSEAAASAEYQGTLYWFCLADHRDAFLDDPEAALRRLRESTPDARP
jgi:YHS domain-containing protein